MKAKDIKIGQRVVAAPDDRLALVVGMPEYYTPRAQLVRIKYENSTRYEYKLNHQLNLCLRSSNTRLMVEIILNLKGTFDVRS